LFIGFGCLLSLLVLHCRTPEVSWRKQPEPYNYYIQKQFKFLNPFGFDYSKAEVPPNYKD